MKTLMMCVALFISIASLAQDSTKQGTPLSFIGFAEAYYSYDLNRPADNNRPSFLYSHNRHNEFNINLAYVRGSYNSEKARANVALAAGTYMNANYAAEPGTLKNIYEANAGARIAKKRDIWIDIGVLPSHIGFESARSSDGWTLTRSIIADNSPYFEAGAKITYTTGNNKWLVSALALNGWQRIQRVPGNSLMSCGTQLQFRPSDKLTVNYSTFLGTDKPDSIRLWRHFHDLYGIFQLTEKIGLILGLDIGQEQKSKGSNDHHTWFGTAGILRFAPNSNWAFALRCEYYSDEKGVIISNGLKTFGASFNADRNISGHFLWRTEIRTLNSNTAATTSFALLF